MDTSLMDVVSPDAAPPLRNNKTQPCYEEGNNKRISSSLQLPCGHPIPPDYLIAWVQYQLEQSHTEFTCPSCGAAISYQRVRGLVHLKPEKQQYFEETIASLTALKLCDYKNCPGCQSYVERADLNNLCVQCSICTFRMGRTYQFCWQCQREWKGAYINAKHCANLDCGQLKISQPEATSSLKLCHPEFKREKLQSDKDDIYLSFDKSARRSRLALIINNLQFEHISDRSGAEIDEHRMRILLELLGYMVVTLRNLTSQGTEAALEHFAHRREHEGSDGCFVVLMSHGTQDSICGVSYSNVQEDVLPVNSIFAHLNTVGCPALRDKPKVQACRGDTVSYRNPKTGSVFIQTVVDTLNNHAHEEHIDELLRMVQKTFKDKYPDQMPCKDRTTLLKKFYLFPGL